MEPLLKKKVLLVNPKPMSDNFSSGLPIGLLALASVIRDEYEVKIVMARPMRDYYKEALNFLDDDTLCVGFSVMTGYQITDAINICKLIRKKNPKVKIIWGGVHPTLLPEQTAKSEWVDIVIKSYCETAFREIVDCLAQHKPYADVKGIVYREGSNVVSTPPRVMDDPNDLPRMPYELVSERILNNDLVDDKTVEYISSRGCFFECAFCFEIKMSQKVWKGLSSGRVLDDFEWLSKIYGIKKIRMLDSLFFTNKRRAKEIFQGIVDRKIPIRLEFLNGRTRQLNMYEPEMWELMKKCGVIEFLVGAESGTDAVLELINKGCSVEDTKKLVRTCNKYGLKVILSCMTGLPQIPGLRMKEEFNSTLDLIAYAWSINSNNDAYLIPFTPYPNGTALWNLCVKNGYKEPQTLEGWGEVESYRHNTPWVPRKYKRWVQMIQYDYIFPFINGSIERYWLPKIKRFKPVAKIGYKVALSVARFRFRHKFFYLPAEWYLIRLYKYLRTKQEDKVRLAELQGRGLDSKLDTLIFSKAEAK